MCNQCTVLHGQKGESSSFCSCAQFHLRSFFLAYRQKAIRSQKPVLHKLLSSSNLRQLYLFIVCSRAALLLRGIVRRGDLSLPTPPRIAAFPSKQLLCLLLCFCIVPLRARQKKKKKKSSLIVNQDASLGRSSQK